MELAIHLDAKPVSNGRLGLLALSAFVLTLDSPAASAFDYFEHRFLGNAAYQRALTEYGAHPISGLLDSALRKDLGLGKKPAPPGKNAQDRYLSQLPVQFGDLAALAGDFTKDAGDLRALLREIDERRGYRAKSLIVATRKQWYSACKWLYRLRGHRVDGDVSWENCLELSVDSGSPLARPRNLFGARGYRASREELAENEMIDNYITLASQNKDHFPRYSWKAYSAYHANALRLARCYGSNRSCIATPDPREPGDAIASPERELSGEALLVEAMLNEGFAQHFLHDSFSAGHIGTKYSDCTFGFLWCTPTKRRMQQTHDVLNELGVDVEISNPSEYLRLTELGTEAGVGLRNGWTVFGDDHLFIPEADFQRAIVVHVASRSIIEVLENADKARAEPAQSLCQMCSTDIFPVPTDAQLISDDAHSSFAYRDLTSEDYPVGNLARFEPLVAESDSVIPWYRGDERSADLRVPGIPVEGWKVGFGLVREFLPWEPGSALETGALFRLDYLRNTERYAPNSYGFEYWALPNLRSSYLFTLAWSFPREVAPLSASIIAKYGWRIEEAFTRKNGTSSGVGGVEVSFPTFEVTWEVYRPVTLFFVVDTATVFFRPDGRVSELINHGYYNFAFGFKFDLSGV